MAKNETSKEEQIGFSRGALTTLAKEREGLLNMLTIVEQFMQMHVKELKDLGVDLEKAAKAAAKPKKSAKKMDDLIG